MPYPIFWKTSAGCFRRLRQEMLHDLPGGGAPDTGVRADVFECGIQRADSMRLACDGRVDGNGHDAGNCLTLTVERVELTPQHRFEFGNRHFHLEVGRYIVRLNRI